MKERGCIEERLGNEISETWWSVEDTAGKAVRKDTVRKDTQVPVLGIRDATEGELLPQD